MRRIIAITFALVLLIAMIVTNPGMNRYAKWFDRDIVPKNQGSIIATIGERLREPVIKSSTMVKNYVFLSYYSTVIGSKQVNSIGILNTFICDGLSSLGMSIFLSFVFMILMMLIIL